MAAAKYLEQRVFAPAGLELPQYRIGCGWPTFKRDKTGAECWSPKQSADGTYEIFMSPKYADPVLLLKILTHELCHTVVGIEAKHKRDFISIARSVGLVAPWKSPIMAGEVALVLGKIAGQLGPYPHAVLTSPGRAGKKQSTRMIKLTCPECDYVIRTTRKHLDEKGAPICPVHKIAFEQEQEKEQEESGERPD